MTWKSYAAVTGAGILATYLVSPLQQDRVAPQPAAAGADASRAAPAPDIVQEAARLEGRLRAEAAFRAPARNPFRFGEPPAPEAPRSAAAAPIDSVAIDSPSAPEPPFIVLSGIATDIVDGAPDRTAVLTTTAGVVLARVGDTVAAEYRVREIREDAVDLESTIDGSLRQLRFRIPD